MLVSCDVFDVAPPEVKTFERCWLLTLTLNVFVGILILPYAAAQIGLVPALLANLSLFVVGGMLMVQINRRSNGARWFLALPFNAGLALYDLSQWLGMPMEGPSALIVPMHLGVAFYATCWLFAPASRAWFAWAAPIRAT
jgi:hypothetical protein